MTEAHDKETSSRKAWALPREDKVAIVLLLVFSAVVGGALVRCGSSPEEPQAVRSQSTSPASQEATDALGQQPADQYPGIGPR